MRGNGTGLKYTWTAHANADYPETIFFNKSDMWFDLGPNMMVVMAIKACSHETLHNILWHEMGVHNMDAHDRIIRAFKRKIKEEAPKTCRDYNIRF